MHKSEFTEEQIAFALRQAEAVTGVDEICRKLAGRTGMGSQTLGLGDTYHEQPVDDAGRVLGNTCPVRARHGVCPWLLHPQNAFVPKRDSGIKNPRSWVG